MRWRDIPGWPTYQASSAGAIRNKKRRWLVNPFLRQGNMCVSLYAEKSYSYVRPVHRLVLEAFRGPCPAGKRGSHLDSNGTNNRLSNLAWSTPKEIAARRAKTIRYREALKLRSERQNALKSA